jgi:tetratricopeptide (TPR) repeat protein
MTDLAAVLWYKNDWAASTELAYEVLALRRKLHGGQDHPAVAEALQDVGTGLEMIGDVGEAERFLREALAMKRRLGADDDVSIAIFHNLSAVAEKKGDWDQAEHLQRESVAICRKVYGNGHPELASSMERLATILRNRHEYAASEATYEEALRIQRAALPEGHPSFSFTLCGLGQVMVQKGLPSDGEVLIQECLDIHRKLRPPGHWRIAQAESLLGACRVAQLRFEEAEPLLVRSCAIIQQQPGPRPSAQTKVEALQRVIDLYESWDAAEPGKGYDAKAAEWRAKLETGDPKLDTSQARPTP